MIQFLMNAFENIFRKFRLLIINNINLFKKIAREAIANTQKENRNNVAEK